MSSPPQKFKKDPYVTTLGGFSKVTNYIYDAFRGTEEQHQRPPEEVADLLGEVIPVLDINQQEEPGFEVITRVRGGGGGDVTFSLSDASAKSSNSNLCRCGCARQIDLGTRPQVVRSSPVSADDWSKHLDPEGRMTDVPRLKQAIFKGARSLHHLFFFHRFYSF